MKLLPYSPLFPFSSQLSHHICIIQHVSRFCFFFVIVTSRYYECYLSLSSVVSVAAASSSLDHCRVEVVYSLHLPVCLSSIYSS